MNASLMQDTDLFNKNLTDPEKNMSIFRAKQCTIGYK